MTTFREETMKKQSNQLYRYCFTLNNYRPEDPLELQLCFNKLCKYYVFQEETGENGTPHLQGAISLKKKMRITEMKKINEKIHWEGTNNEEAAKKYCMKEESRTGNQWKYEKKKMFTRSFSKHDELKPLKEVISLIEQEPDKRTINWIWSEEGAVGKTSTAAFIEHNYEGVCVANGKGADIKNQVINHIEREDLDCMIVTIPRSAQEYIGGLYGVLEEIKDGLIYSGKYEGGFANIEHPHVIVMCNFKPDMSKMSKDRWNVVEIKK